jgi:hypothetical protein
MSRKLPNWTSWLSTLLNYLHNYIAGAADAIELSEAIRDRAGHMVWASVAAVDPPVARYRL